MKNGDIYDIEFTGSSQQIQGYPDGTKLSETTICAVYMKDGKRMAINPNDIEKLEMNGAVFAVK